MDETTEQGTLLAGMAGEEWLRWVAVDVSGPLETARSLRDLGPVATTALGRALGGVALLYRHALRAPERLELRVRGDGPLGGVSAEISQQRFRGRVGNPGVPNAHFGEQGQRLQEAVGSGVLEVTREGKRGTFNSHSELVTGEIGSDIAHYLLQSEQTRSVLAVGEFLTRDGIGSAGGYLVEALPGTPDSVVRTLERNLERAGSWSVDLQEYGLEGALQRVLAGLGSSTREQDVLEYRCGCKRISLLQRLQSLPKEDLRHLAQTDEVTAQCEYCGTSSRFQTTEILALNRLRHHGEDQELQ